MFSLYSTRVPIVFATVLASAAIADQRTSEIPRPVKIEAPTPSNHKIGGPHRRLPRFEQVEPQTTTVPNAGFGTTSAFTSATPNPNATSVSPPLTLTYGGSSPVLLINDSGTNKGLESLITNKSNETSALYGSTNGSGAGLTGYNNGPTGPAGKFGITDAESTAPAVSVTTAAHNAPALMATITGDGAVWPAIYAVNTIFNGNTGPVGQYGVEGDGASVGVFGFSPYTEGFGVVGFASGNGIGVQGYSPSGIAVEGTSDGGIGMYALTGSGDEALLAKNSGSGAGLFAHSVSGMGIFASSDSGIGIEGQSTNSTGVAGEDLGNGTGVYAYSATGNALGAYATTGNAIFAHATTGVGLNVASDSGYAIDARTTNSRAIMATNYDNNNAGVAIYAQSLPYGTGYAGWFDGIVVITQTLTVGNTLYTSDKNMKTDLAEIDGKQLLDRLNRIPMSSWKFKSDPTRRHVGPMAQDFQAAFGLNGSDDTHISMLDIAGVNLAATQALNRELQAQLKEKDLQIAAIQTQVKELSEMVESLTRLAAQQSGRRESMIASDASDTN